MALGAEYFWVSQPGIRGAANPVQEVLHPNKKQRHKWAVQIRDHSWGLYFCNRRIRPFHAYFHLAPYGFIYGYPYSAPSAVSRDLPIHGDRGNYPYTFLEEVVRSNLDSISTVTMRCGVTVEGDFHVLVGDQLDLVALLPMSTNDHTYGLPIGRWRFNKGINVPEVVARLFPNYNTPEAIDINHTLRMLFSTDSTQYNSDVDNQRFNRSLWSSDNSRLGVEYEYRLRMGRAPESLPYYVSLYNNNGELIQGPPDPHNINNGWARR